MIPRKNNLLNLIAVLALIAPGGTQPPAAQAQSVVFVPQQPQAGLHLSAESQGAKDEPRNQLLHLSAVTASTAPGEAVNDSNIVYVCNDSDIGRTGDISMTSPIWSNITPPGVGTINDCVPDPWSPTTTMWVVGSTGIWKGDNLNTATPLWTVLQTTDQIRSATDGFTQNGSEPDRIVPSASISGTVFVLYSHGGLGSTPNTWVGRSTDNGATWAWTRVANEGEQARDFGFAITQNAVSPDNVTVWASTRQDHLYKSTDGGKSFQRVLSLPSTTFYQLHAIYSPPLGNDGSILYVGGGSSSGATSFISKTVDGGMTWATISPVGADSAPRGSLRQYEIAGAAGSASHLYALVQRAQDVVNERKKLYYSSDGGASWSLRQDFASRTDEVLGIGVNATDENRLYVLKDSSSAAATDLIFLSDDGGVTWQDRSGNWRAGVGLWRNAVAVWDASAQPVPLVDLSIDSVEPVQVLEGQDLVQNKSTAVRVVIKNTGSGTADNISVRLDWSSGGSFSESRFYVAEDENMDADDYSLIDDNERYPLSFATNEISKTIFFFSENLAPVNNTIQVSATVDYLGTIIEDDETNNTETISRTVYDVQWTNGVFPNLTIHYARVDWGKTPLQDYYDYITIANEFIRDVYPVSEQRFSPTYNPIGLTNLTPLPANCDLPYETCLWLFLNFITSLYQSLKFENPLADRYIAMVPDGWICTYVPGQTCDKTGMVFPMPVLDDIAIVQPGLTPRGRLPGGESALVAAHEIGHTYGLPVHPCAEEYDGDCNGVPDRIGEFAAPGLWVSRRIPIRVPDEREAYCFMGGGTANHDKKYWVDAEDYAKLFNDHKVVSSSQVSIFDEATQGILATGTFGISGTVTLGTWYVLSEAELSTLTPGPYSFEYQDANGAILYQQSFAITYTVWGETFEQIPFVSTIPYIPNTAKIVVKYENVPLAEKVVSPNTPAVTVVSPNGGEQLSGQAEISWVGADADGDTLAYVIQLTLDNGASWTTLAVGLASTSYMFDVSQLPPGTQYRIKVIASDGINTGQDVSNAPFTILGQVYLPLIMR